jgi:hypothetical protein
MHPQIAQCASGEAEKREQYLAAAEFFQGNGFTVMVGGMEQWGGVARQKPVSHKEFLLSDEWQAFCLHHYFNRNDFALL